MTSDARWFLRLPHQLEVLDANIIAQEAARFLVETLNGVLAVRTHAVLIASAGRTPRDTYMTLRRSFRSAVEWRRVICVQMDEYAGVGADDPRGLAAELQHTLIEPLGIGQFIRFLTADGTLVRSLIDYERQVHSLGGIDFALHGLGRNGHIGFNEPGKVPRHGTRNVILAESTRQANGVGFRKGLTLGTRILSQARVSLVLLIGAEKREAARALLFDASGPQNPAACLRACPRVRILLDPAAVPACLGPFA